MKYLLIIVAAIHFINYLISKGSTPLILSSIYTCAFFIMQNSDENKEVIEGYFIGEQDLEEEKNEEI